MIVVDASALLEVLLNTTAGPAVARHLFADHETLHAPHLIDLEISQVLRRYALAGQLESARAEEALDDLADLPLTRYPHKPFRARIWELRHNFTAYDAAYLALAETLDARMITRDEALASIELHNAAVTVV